MAEEEGSTEAAQEGFTAAGGFTEEEGSTVVAQASTAVDVTTAAIAELDTIVVGAGVTTAGAADTGAIQVTVIPGR